MVENTPTPTATPCPHIRPFCACPLVGEHDDCMRTEPHWPTQCVAPYPQNLHDPEHCDLDNVHLVPSCCHAPEELPDA